MICPSCGSENRPGAHFCARCGMPLEGIFPHQPGAYPAEPSVEPVGPAPASGPGDMTETVGKIGLFGGHGLITFGALMVLFAFMLPWASCSNVQLSGLDIVTQPSQYGGDTTWTLLLLVPLGALALLVLGIAGLVVSAVGKVLPVGLARLVPFFPLLAALPGLCGCCPSLAFFLNIQKARSDPSGWGMLIQVRYGFWLTLLGLGVSFIGIVVALVGGLMAQRHTTPKASLPP